MASENSPINARDRLEANIDVRDQRDGNWSWVQNELYSFFLPIVGREATHLYQVMTWLIGKKLHEPLLELNQRKIAKESGMGAGTVSRELKVLHQAGMLPQIYQGKGETPLFVLADLRKLMRLGEAEIRRRITAPQWSTGCLGGESDPPPDGSVGEPEGGQEGLDTPRNGITAGETRAASPAVAGENTAPQWSSSSESGSANPESRSEDQISAITTALDLPLLQKRGGTAPQEAVPAPERGGTAPQWSAYIRKKI